MSVSWQVISSPFDIPTKTRSNSIFRSEVPHRKYTGGHYVDSGGRIGNDTGKQGVVKSSSLGRSEICFGSGTSRNRSCSGSSSGSNSATNRERIFRRFEGKSNGNHHSKWVLDNEFNDVIDQEHNVSNRRILFDSRLLSKNNVFANPIITVFPESREKVVSATKKESKRHRKGRRTISPVKGRHHATTQTEEKYFEDDFWAKTMTTATIPLEDEQRGERTRVGGDDNGEIKKPDTTPQEKSNVDAEENTINREKVEDERKEGEEGDLYANLVKFILDEARERVLNALDTSVDNSVVSAPT